MWTTLLKFGAPFLTTAVAVIGGLRAQQTPAGIETESKPAVSAAVAQTEAKLAKLRELISPRPGEHVTNMAKIAWERDPWVAAVKAGKEGKPVLVYAEGAAGIACGYG